MKWEYILFNLLILAGPVAFSFDREIRYVRYWRQAAIAFFGALIPFIIWDALVTGRHWWFNEEYTSGISLAGLPLGEWLFFITVPFACLFIWEIIATKKRPDINSSLKFLYYLFYTGAIAGIWVFNAGKEYTGLVLIALGIVALLDKFIKTSVIIQGRTYLFLSIVTVLILVFNGYLTARPVVLYGEQFQLDFRILTIPIEDFFYGFSLLLLNVIFYEKLRRRVYA